MARVIERAAQVGGRCPLPALSPYSFPSIGKPVCRFGNLGRLLFYNRCWRTLQAEITSRQKRGNAGTGWNISDACPNRLMATKAVPTSVSNSFGAMRRVR